MGSTVELIKAFLHLQQSLEKFKDKDFKSINHILPIMEELMRATLQVEDLKKTCVLQAWQIEFYGGDCRQVCAGCVQPFAW